MTLLLDTTNPQTVWFALIEKGELFAEYSWTTNRDLSERLLVELKKFLGQRGLSLTDLSKLAVVTGPGQFSCLRTGVAVTNALAFGLSINVVGVKAEYKTAFAEIDRQKGEGMVLPYYDRGPNISKPRKFKLQKIR